MGNDVFANGRELSCKAGSGKSICAFPDVCFTPPQTPATPPGVPIPYPNTGMTSDTSKGSRDVKITKKEVMLKNKSMFKKSLGDQAGCAPKKGVVTSKTGGKVYFNAWSMDVKIEGENAVRHLDLTTHNHGSVPGNSPTWPFIDQMTTGEFPDDSPCKKDIIKEQEACKDFTPYGEKDPCEGLKHPGNKSKMTDPQAMDLVVLSTTSQEKMTAKSEDYHFKGGEKVDPKGKNTSPTSGDYDDCLTARSCQLVPYQPLSGEASCCESQTGHHLVEASSFFETGRGTGKSKTKTKPAVSKADDIEANIFEVACTGTGKDAKMYDTGRAPSVCVWGPNQNTGTHGLTHTIQGNLNEGKKTRTNTTMKKKFGGEAKVPTVTYAEARQSGIDAAQEVHKAAGCDPKCLEKQLDAYHKDELNIKDSDPIKCVAAGKTSPEAKKSAKRKLDDLYDGDTSH